MDNKGEGNRKVSASEINIDSHIKKIKTKDVEISLYIKKQKNPAQLLENLYLLRHDDSLSKEEKNQAVKKIMVDYMR
ncbi:MAG: hypothetical protein GXY88_09860 [Tissierellia bacterium]|nr:hypothetical protein [Tissierellia bacterium]